MQNTSKFFENHFCVEKAEVDRGLISFEEGNKDKVAKAFFDYQHAVDIVHNREVEIVDIGREKSVVLPKSTRNRSKVVYAGAAPIFASFDKNLNLITYVFLGSVIRVEYLGMNGREKKVKYFRCW